MVGIELKPRYFANLRRFAGRTVVKTATDCQNVNNFSSESARTQVRIQKAMPKVQRPRLFLSHEQ